MKRLANFLMLCLLLNFVVVASFFGYVYVHRDTGAVSSALLAGSLADGGIEALIVQNPFEIGRRGVRRALDALENRQGEAFTAIPVFVVTRRNLERMKRKFPAARGL